MSGRTSAPYASHTRPRVRPSGRGSAARGVTAAVIAASGLLLAANVGPAGAADTPQAPASVVRQAGG
ncbi:hypothetical protein [Streptomyces rubradiris]|uniref:hypothetical protein n=1 Tax=Streptomyces rubradiris TaxID=285531 RepID=UPI00167A9327|nr:hypothetical protein [Streptomyces rubradiris]